MKAGQELTEVHTGTLAQAGKKARHLTQRAPIIVLLVSLLVLAWVILVCWGLYTFLHWIFVG